VLVKDVVYRRLGKAYRCVVIAASSIEAIVAYLPTLAFISIVNRF